METPVIGMSGGISLWLEQPVAAIDVQLTLFGQLNAEAEIQSAAKVSTKPRKDWWNTPYGRWRLEAEERAMRERFPGFQAVLEEREIYWVGSLQSALTGGERYLVNVIYGPAFPDIPPKVIVAEPEFPVNTPHLLVAQQPCLYIHGNSARGYDPASTTAATLVAWTALWIHAYETWRQTGTWPGRGA